MDACEPFLLEYLHGCSYLTRGLRQMRGNIGEYIIFIIPSYRFFCKQNMFYNTPIIVDEIGKVKNQKAYSIVVLQHFKAISLSF